MRKFAVACLVLLAFIVPTASASADVGGCVIGADSPCNAEQYQKEYGERFVEIRDINDSRMEMESKLVNATSDIEDKFQIYVDTSDTLEITLLHKNENLSNNKEPKITETNIIFDRLIEYDDANNNGKFDKGENVSKTTLSGYDPITMNQYTDGNATIHEITATTTDGMFEVVFYASGDFADIGSTVVTPSEMKVDVSINGYQYDNSDTSLALGAMIDTGTTHDGNVLVANTGGDYDTFFSWTDTAEVDGENVSVNATTFDNKVAISYGEQVNNVFHDPTVGFIPSTGGNGIVASVVNFLKSIFQTVIGFLPF